MRAGIITELSCIRSRDYGSFFNDNQYSIRVSWHATCRCTPISVIFVFITSTEEGGYVFGSVCLSVCPLDYSQTCERILKKLFVGVWHGSSDTILVVNWITLWIQSPKSEIRILWFTQKLHSVFGGGLCSLSTPSSVLVLVLNYYRLILILWCLHFIVIYISTFSKQFLLSYLNS